MRESLAAAGVPLNSAYFCFADEGGRRLRKQNADVCILRTNFRLSLQAIEKQ